MPRSAAETLASLRRRVSKIEMSGDKDRLPEHGVVPLGAPCVDTVLGGGLARGTLHSACAACPGDPAALIGLGLGLAARASEAGGQVLWVQHGLAALEAGGLYAPGLDAFGLSPERLILVRARRPDDALWAMEEGLRCRALSAVVGEFRDGDAVDLKASRRLALAAREGGAISLVLTHIAPSHPSAAMTRWRAGAAPSVAADSFGGLGRTALAVTLTRNRNGPCGHWTILWNPHEHAFAETLSVDLAAPAFDRPDRAPHVA